MLIAPDCGIASAPNGNPGALVYSNDGITWMGVPTIINNNNYARSFNVVSKIVLSQMPSPTPSTTYVPTTPNSWNATPPGSIQTALDQAILPFSRIAVSAATYTVLATDTLLGVTYTSTGAVTLTLPAATAYINKFLNIIDEGGNAQTNNITINRAGSDTINGGTSVVMNKNYQSLQLYSNGTNGWFYQSFSTFSNLCSFAEQSSTKTTSRSSLFL